MKQSSLKLNEKAVTRSTAALTVTTIILAASLGLVELAPRSPTTPASVTYTSTTTTTLTEPQAYESTSTASATTSPSNGVALSASINASVVGAGEGLSVTVSVSNDLPTVNDVHTSNDWQFQGVPIELWPVCYYSPPAEVAVLSGNFSADQLSLVANSKLSYECAEGGSVDHVIFQPSSDRANLTGVICVASCDNETLGPYDLSYSFAVNGYWNMQYLANEVNVPIIGMQGSQLYSTPFSPGVYTVAVADEWGQVTVLHFEVPGSVTVPGVALEGFSICVSNCLYPGPLLSGVIYFNASSPVRTFFIALNDTTEGGIAGGYSIPFTGTPFVYTGQLSSRVVAGDDYVVTFTFLFENNSTTVATTNVVAR